MGEITVEIPDPPEDDGAELEAAAGAVEAAAQAAEAAADAAAAVADAAAAALSSREEPHEDRSGEWQASHAELRQRVEGLEAGVNGRLDALGMQMSQLAEDLTKGTEPTSDVDETIVTPDLSEQDMLDEQAKDLPWWKRLL
ncbi:MAG: hypothetical protein ACYCV4_02525 [Dermatophilaceae bacterium]